MRADVLPPQIVLLIDENPVDFGDTATIIVMAVGNVGIFTRELFINGAPLAMDSLGRANVRLDFAGFYQIAAIATDTAGLTSTAVENLIVRYPTDQEAPLVGIDSPVDDVAVSAPIDILGSVQDDNLLSYTLSVSVFGEDAFREFDRGTQPVAQGVLGPFDPSLLTNNVYVLRLADDTASSGEGGGKRSGNH